MKLLDDLEALAKKATPGEWIWFTSNSHSRLSSKETGKDGEVISAFVATDGWPCVSVSTANMRFTEAANPATILAIAGHVRKIEGFKSAYMEWSAKTDWVQTDRRFGVLKPWGKHRADVMREYIDHLESELARIKAAVPGEERIHNEFDDFRIGWNACRAEMLRIINGEKDHD